MARAPRFSLSLGRLIADSLRVYARNFVPFVSLCAVALAPYYVLEIGLDNTGDNTFLNLLSAVLYLMLSSLLTGAVAFGVVQQLRGESVSLVMTLVVGMRSFARVFGTAFVCGIRVFLFAMLLLVPGMIEATRLFVAVPAAVMEGVGPGKAIERSIRLTDGSRWAIFGIWLLPRLVIFAITYTLTMMSRHEEDPLQWQEYLVWINIGLDLLTSPLMATASAVAYFELRMAKENLDANAIAKVFD